MKIVKNGNQIKVYDDDLVVMDYLEPGIYRVDFAPMSGFYLTLIGNNFNIGEKIYGNHKEKVDKVIKNYHHFNRNLGVLLSGPKGIGKTLFSKMLCNKIIEEGKPVIVVNQNHDGIADFLNSIEQEYAVLFDEYDKVFGSYDSDEDNGQEALLTLFDGVYSGTDKRMFIITCNNTGDISEFLINRPGRIHYHLRFDEPEADGVREYLLDNLIPEAQQYIEDVVKFSMRFSLNYDCLRAIAFELNCGESFRDAIQDLNIINNGQSRNFSVIIKTDNDTIVGSMWNDLFDEDCQFCHFNYHKTELCLSFYNQDLRFNENGDCSLPVECVKVSARYGNDEEDARLASELSKKIVEIKVLPGKNSSIESFNFNAI